VLGWQALGAGRLRQAGSTPPAAREAVERPGERPHPLTPVAVRVEVREAAGSGDRELVVDGYVGPYGHGTLTPADAWVQRSRIQEWTARRGWRVGRILEEAPSSACPDQRAELVHALARVESRESDGIVIMKLNQIGPSLGKALAAIERIQAAGATLVSIGDAIDLSTPAGHRLLRLLMSIQDW
jgi:resolvase-like protein